MKTVIIAFVGVFIGFFGGLFWEHTANQQTLDEIVQAGQEACDLRIKTLKATCK